MRPEARTLPPDPSVPTNCNPTGHTLSDAARRELVDVCALELMYVSPTQDEHTRSDVPVPAWLMYCALLHIFFAWHVLFGLRK